MSIFTTFESAFVPSVWSVYASVILIIAGGSGYLGWHERALREPDMLASQQSADTKACSNAQAITKGENDALNADRNRIAADAARYKLRHPETCIYPARTSKLQPGGGQHAILYGISTDWLRDYSAVCETYRSEVMVCTGQTD